MPRRQLQPRYSGLVDQFGNPVQSMERSGPGRGRRIDNWVSNKQTGLGQVGRDKTLGTTHIAPFISDVEAEDIYTGSALAAKVVDIPVEDALMRWRTFKGDNAEYFRKAERHFKVKKQMSSAAKDARVYGTSLLIMRLADDAWDQPLNMDAIHPGTLRGLTVLDRRAINHVVIDYDLLSPTFGEALYYDVTFPRLYTNYRIHASRALRFDGLMSNSERDFRQTTRWGLGISIFVRLAEQLETLATSLQSLAHLETEAGMPVLRLAGYDDTVGMITPGSGEGTTLNKVEEINKNRSIYYTTIMDAEDEYVRLDTTFAGRAPLLIEYKSMLAAASDIPETRLFGRSPHGLNATGESDARNYAVKIAEIQENVYDPVLEILDIVIAKSIDLQAPPTFKWEPLLDLSETEQVANRKTEIDTLATAIEAKIMTPEEARRQFSTMPGMEWLDDGPMPPELMQPTQEEIAAEMGYDPALAGGGIPGALPSPPGALGPGGGAPPPGPGAEAGGGAEGDNVIEGEFEPIDEDEALLAEIIAEEMDAEEAAIDAEEEALPERFSYRQMV